MGIFFWDSVPSDDWDLCQLGHLSDCWGFGIVDDGESGIKTKRSAWQHYPIWTHWPPAVLIFSCLTVFCWLRRMFNRQIWDWSSHLTLGKKLDLPKCQNIAFLRLSITFLAFLKNNKKTILLYLKSKMKGVCVVAPEGNRVVPGCLLHVSEKTNSSGCPQINVITEAIDLVLIGWERHFTRWLGLHEVVIKDVLREQLSWGLAGYVPAASLSRRWQHSKLTNVCLEYHNGSCWYWGWTNPVLLAYKWTVWLIQVEEKAHDSAGVNHSFKMYTFKKRHSHPFVSLSFLSSLSLPIFLSSLLHPLQLWQNERSPLWFCYHVLQYFMGTDELTAGIRSDVLWTFYPFMAFKRKTEVIQFRGYRLISHYRHLSFWCFFSVITSTSSFFSFFFPPQTDRSNRPSRGGSLSGEWMYNT